MDLVFMTGLHRRWLLWSNLRSFEGRQLWTWIMWEINRFTWHRASSQTGLWEAVTWAGAISGPSVWCWYMGTPTSLWSTSLCLMYIWETHGDMQCRGQRPGPAAASPCVCLCMCPRPSATPPFLYYTCGRGKRPVLGLWLGYIALSSTFPRIRDIHQKTLSVYHLAIHGQEAWCASHMNGQSNMQRTALLTNKFYTLYQAKHTKMKMHVR